MFRYDESDPACLVAYTGATHPEPEDYVGLLERWHAWIQRGQRFGVVLVTEPHSHDDHDHDDAHHREDEAEITNLINDFRRDYRELANRHTTGFVRVADEEEMRPYVENIPGGLVQIRAAQERFARYSFGVRGNIAYSVEEAKRWLSEIAALDPLPLEGAGNLLVGRVGLFYGSTTGVTEYVADEIAATWKESGFGTLNAVNIGAVKDMSVLLDYEYLILGIPTWNIGQLQDDWEIALPALDELDFNGRQVALFGVGDQYGYPDNFLDAMGILGERLEARGATLVGFTDTAGYEFSESLALRDGRFMGLAIDDDGQPNETRPRIQRWLTQIIGEFEFQLAE